jgi:cysteine synthase A
VKTTSTSNGLAERKWVNQAIATLRADAADCGETPLLRLCGLPLPGVDVYLKDETAHSTGSLKHRLARALLLSAICKGQLSKGTPVIEASSGSTAVSEAYFTSMLGLAFCAVMPRTTSPSKIALIEARGGRSVLVDDPASIYQEAHDLAGRTGGHYLDQFTNAADAVDWRGDQNLAAETARQLAGCRYPVPTWIVVGAGTGGTASLFARHARYHGRGSRLCVVDPENSAFMPGWLARDRGVNGGSSRIEGIGRPRVEPSFPSFDAVDHMIQVPDAASIATIRELERWSGRRFGGSTGTTMWGALELAAQMHTAGVRGSILAIAGDCGDRYTDTYYNDAWLDEQGLEPDPYRRVLEGLPSRADALKRSR